jgi:hypothetical protein
MSLATALYARLVAEGGAENVYPVRLPDNPELPALVYQNISGPREYSHDGEAGPHRTRWQVTAWGETYEDAKELAASAILAISAWEGTVSSERCVAFVANETDFFDDVAQLFYVPIDVVVLLEHSRT